jgi:hypothetical protein
MRRRSACRWWSSRGRQPGQGRDGQHRRRASTSPIAYRACRRVRRRPMVERFVPGHDFRLLVVGDKLVAAARRDPPHVIGDGVHTCEQLVDQVNSRPRRGDGHATSLTKIRFDEIALPACAAGLTRPTRCAGPGPRVILRNNANLSTGGTATDVTDDVHPELAARAPWPAAQMVGLDICGVDVVCETCRSRSRSRAAASSRSTPRPACACTWRPPTARAAPWARPSSRPVRGRRRRPHPGGGGHRHQRQDHRRAPDRAPARRSRACASA